VRDIRVPASSDAARCRSSFLKLRRRGSIDFAVLDVAAAVWTDARGAVTRARMFLGAVASLPSPVEIEPILAGRPLDADGIAGAAKLARRTATPMDNTDFQAQWRGAMVEAYAARALRAIAGS
jgi:4-hydroxybenzoyl-CoA reductase subunit beta